jgi:hypothetical protein
MDQRFEGFPEPEQAWRRLEPVVRWFSNGGGEKAQTRWKDMIVK